MGRKTKEQLQSELDTIRELKKVPLTDKQIMEQLKIPERTYYWYVALLRKRDKKILERQLDEGLGSEIRLLYDKLVELEQSTLDLLKHDSTTKEKLDVINTIRQIAIDRATLMKEGPEILGYDIRQQLGDTEKTDTKEKETVKPEH